MINKIGQLFFIGLESTDLLPHEAQFIINNNIGGVVLFGRNVESPEQIFRLTTELQALTKRMHDKLPMLIGIDMEGGRVHRLKPPFTQWPAAKKLGDLDSTSMSFKFAQAMGTELRSVGINLDFAPCVDINTNPNNPVIGDRALGDNEEIVSKHASALVRGYIKAGIIPCVKHFPGHGNTSIDSHLELPVEATTLEQLRGREMLPFKKVFRARTNITMTGHLLFKNIDPDNPVTFSEIFLKKILREEVRYQGIVVSDDLDMKALTNYHAKEEIPVKALQAGCDMLLYCNDFNKPSMAIESVKKALKQNQLSSSDIEQCYQRVIELKKQFLVNQAIVDFTESKKVIGCEEHEKIVAAINSGKIPKELSMT